MGQQLLNGVFVGSIYALFAVGYTLVFGVLDLLNLAHAAIFMWAAMAAWVMVAGWGWPLLLAGPAAMLFAGVLGLVLDRVAFWPLRRRPSGHLSPLISSIAFAAILTG